MSCFVSTCNIWYYIRWRTALHPCFYNIPGLRCEQSFTTKFVAESILSSQDELWAYEKWKDILEHKHNICSATLALIDEYSISDQQKEAGLFTVVVSSQKLIQMSRKSCQKWHADEWRHVAAECIYAADICSNSATYRPPRWGCWEILYIVKMIHWNLRAVVELVCCAERAVARLLFSVVASGEGGSHHMKNGWWWRDCLIK